MLLRVLSYSGQKRAAMTYLPAKASLYDDPAMGGLLMKASEDERTALVEALDAAYRAGQDDADARTAKLMTRIFSTFIGVTPGIDQIAADGTPEGSRVRKMMNLMRGR